MRAPLSPFCPHRSSVAGAPPWRRFGAACAAAIVLLLGGCGQTGALYLPEPDADAPDDGVSVEEPNARDTDRDEDTP